MYRCALLEELDYLCYPIGSQALPHATSMVCGHHRKPIPFWGVGLLFPPQCTCWYLYSQVTLIRSLTSSHTQRSPSVMIRVLF